MKTVNEKYLEVIKKCKFISKPDEWFVEGTECVIEDNVIYPEYKQDDKFNAVCGLFNGLTMETYKGYSGELPRPDGETCPFDEFLIYDELGNEISELTFEEYELLLNLNSHMKEKKTYEKISIALSPEILSKLEAGDYNKSKLIDSLLTEYFKKEKGQGEAPKENIQNLNTMTLKYKVKTRKFEVKLESIDATGVVLKSQELSMMIVDDPNSMINNDRLFIHIGECLYRIDKKGFIIERIVPHE